ncbi:hypothetical protein L6164_007805 [Bauhinia variegata]|uniref:Uncharacterized protein n=1 Tax=Bauhinia variegata TaxID=167791 RepID=A0ACB9PEN2_BAUVA|nr:hypothetical protein L6164_007805 [Bauhinia variegata]
MEVEIEIISRENIKPSSPTPSHLRAFKLSLLDHLIPAPYSPMILFYASQEESAENTHFETLKRIQSLKQSLSETLTQFYPLAGKLKDDIFIECNDEGANFVEARVKCPLSDILSQTDLILLHKFLPCDHLVVEESDSGAYVANIQVSTFDCGGIAIGICISHRILDGSALSTFLKVWKSRAKGCEENAMCPNFIAASLFPIENLWFKDLSMVMWGSLFKQGKFVTKRFLFSNSALSTLKKQLAMKNSLLHNPTRLEIISAILWKSLMAISETRFGTQRHSLVTHLVNLRRRIHKALSPQYAIGNLLWLAAAERKSDKVTTLGELVGELRKSISEIDEKFVERLQSNEGKSVMFKSLKRIGELGSKDEVDHFGFSSWCNLGFYELDFGWGKPIWVSSIGSNGAFFMNLIILVDTRFGDGIEAWVTLDEKDMAHLEANAELATYAILDPSPLQHLV